jgi:ABC-type uncharacterized transport system substrate-binding protein
MAVRLRSAGHEGELRSAGFVSNLGRPEGNVTGVTLIAAELSANRVELLHEIAPSVTRVALLVNPNKPASRTITSNSFRPRCIVADSRC